jgi:hypothetical protein
MPEVRAGWPSTLQHCRLSRTGLGALSPTVSYALVGGVPSLDLSGAPQSGNMRAVDRKYLGHLLRSDGRHRSSRRQAVRTRRVAISPAGMLITGYVYGPSIAAVSSNIACPPTVRHCGSLVSNLAARRPFPTTANGGRRRPRRFPLDIHERNATACLGKGMLRRA